MIKHQLFTSESVTEGHPDKMCDQISDAILDAIYSQDNMARVACETCVTTGLVLVMGEITTGCYVDIPKIARATIREIGYDRAKYGFDCDTCSVITAIDEQSSDIALGVNRGVESGIDAITVPHAGSNELGAGDQGMMFGFACDETSEFMPLPISLSHKLTKRLSDVRKGGILEYLRPDGKAQVTIEYRDGIPVRVASVVVSSQHSPEVDHETMSKDILEHIVKPIIPERFLSNDTKYFINPTGRFVIGGPQGDAGLTGRKIIVDTYGGYARHGGGAFSGKDPTKVDRSASYAARYVAKNIVAAGIAKKCEVQVAYAIGISQPISLCVNTFGTSNIAEDDIVKLIRENFDLTPSGIISTLDLRRPIYKQTAAYGHFGRTDVDLTWEHTDKADTLREFVTTNFKKLTV